jgi:hypothetical protein
MVGESEDGALRRSDWVAAHHVVSSLRSHESTAKVSTYVKINGGRSTE